VKALVTRPREDAEPVAAALRARFIEPVIEPLLAIRFRAEGAQVLGPLLDGAQAVLFTSANGVRAFAAAAPRRGLAAFAVGDATAAAARAAGFTVVASAGGNVADLAALVRRRLRADDGALVHAAASVGAGDLAAALGGAGFTLRRAVLYDAVPAQQLSRETVALLEQRALALALFFSPRTAESFVRLVRAADLGDACRAVSALALSPAVAAALGGIDWSAVHIAAAPSAAALLAAVEAAALACATGRNGA
jgi:uroporphyrinogen-III synthase